MTTKGWPLFHNNGDGTFTRVLSGSPVHDAALYKEDYSSAWADYDGDGFLDLLVGSINGGTAAPDFLYRNSANNNHWIIVRCVGTKSNRAAIGAKVRVQATIGGKTIWQLREISGGGGYGGQCLRAHFGLGDAALAQKVRIERPSGAVSEFSNVAPDQLLTIIEPGPTAALAAVQNTGRVELRIQGLRGVPYMIERSTDLKSWMPGPSLLIRESSGLAWSPDDAGPGRSFFRIRPDGLHAP